MSREKTGWPYLQMTGYACFRGEWVCLYTEERRMVSAIAEAYGCAGRTVLNQLKAAGVDTSDPFSRFADEWVALREEGWSYAAIAREYGCSAGTVSRQVKDRVPPREGGGDLTRTFLCKMEHRARRYDRTWAVNAEYLWALFLQQERRCALSGLNLSMREEGRYSGTASLDRIDSSRGYVRGNVQWVHATVNTMKNDLPQEDFVAFCEAVATHHSRAGATSRVRRRRAPVSRQSVIPS